MPLLKFLIKIKKSNIHSNLRGGAVMIRKKILLYIPLFAFLISCGVGASDSEVVYPEQDFNNEPPGGSSGDTNKPVVDENTIRAFILSGTVDRISVELIGFSLTMFNYLNAILSNFSANNINATFNCSLSGEVRVNINTVDRTFSLVYDQCKSDVDKEINCTVTGSYSESGGVITGLNMTFSDGCNVDRMQSADITFSGTSSVSITIDRYGSDCPSGEGGKGSMSFTNLNVSFSYFSDEFSVQNGNINFSFDAGCTYSGYSEYSPEGSFIYQDNYCLNSSVNVNVQTITPVSYFVDNNNNLYNCGGEVIINNGEVRYVVNNNCSADLYVNNIFTRSVDFADLYNSVGSCSLPD